LIWVQHDFYKNFTSSVNSNDIGLTLDILRSEISDLLTYKSDALYSLFDKLKIKYSKKASYSELLDIVLREIKTNDKFVRGLSFLIGESNEINKSNKGMSWKTLLDGITKGIKRAVVYFKENPRQEKLFRKRTIDMLGLKSSVTGDDTRDLHKKDNTVLWILGITAVCVAGYFIYTYFDKKNQDKLRLESLVRMKMKQGGGIPPVDASVVSSAVAPPAVPDASAQVAPVAPIAPVAPKPLTSNDPAYNVGSDVMLPVSNVAPAPVQANLNGNIPQGGNGGVQVNIQPMQNPNASLG
jgi:hypothetical protein